MTIAVLADASTKNELLQKGFSSDVSVLWPDSVRSLMMLEADCFFDLKFEQDKERTKRLSKLLTHPVFIGAMDNTINEIGDPRFIRLNAWPGFLNRTIVEYACNNESFQTARTVFDKLGWEGIRVADLPGFVTPRIVASIINEAYFALGDKVGSKEDIDRAMKLGTNYPFGPFEWAESIGTSRVLSLLQAMHKTNNRYEIAPILINTVAKN